VARRYKDINTKKEKRKEGRQWKIVGKCPKFKDADDLRNMLTNDDENDVKVHRHSHNDTFVVKMRNKSFRLQKEKNEKLQD
tara:strand:+ start:476 stop:718 length:243 start_codon:yes stop_codon:yes gene_type:complete